MPAEVYIAYAQVVAIELYATSRCHGTRRAGRAAYARRPCRQVSPTLMLAMMPKREELLRVRRAMPAGPCSHDYIYDELRSRNEPRPLASIY